MNRSHFPPIATRTRLAEKQRELAHFVELQNMSAELVAELELLETRLGNLATGTEKVAVVLQNWGNIARALTLASCKFIYYTPAKFFLFFIIYFRLYWLIFCVCMCANFLLWTANLTNIREEDYEDRANPPLPETLVRIRLDDEDNEFAGDESPEEGLDAPQQ